MKYISPLRYPGGKARLYPFLSRIIASQPSRVRTYGEPFAGGVGAGLRLLVNGDVDRLLINDANPGIAAFWRICTQHSDELVSIIQTTPVTIDTWHGQREIYRNPTAYDDLALGFAAFFLNRTNRSGILSAAPIGGLDQNGKWKIDARYNKANLAERIKLIGSLGSRIEVSEKDAKEFLSRYQEAQEDIIFYVDPPYLAKGKKLYMSDFSLDDHTALRDTLREITCPWVLTYDDDALIYENLYKGFRLARFGIAHTANVNHLGSEIIAFSPNVVIPDLEVTRTRSALPSEKLSKQPNPIPVAEPSGTTSVHFARATVLFQDQIL